MPKMLPYGGQDVYQHVPEASNRGSSSVSNTKLIGNCEFTSRYQRFMRINLQLNFLMWKVKHANDSIRIRFSFVLLFHVTLRALKSLDIKRLEIMCAIALSDPMEASERDSRRVQSSFNR
jgi:hypothetical protein